ncbi:MAG: response regulator transcription factor [Bacteroidota bacterium]|jgi:two-component system alkaline phosphatase synthesis response regulator PhoP
MSYKILIIEDEKTLMETITLNLQLENYEVFSLNTGKDAINQIIKITPDLILLDIMLPESNGIEIYKSLLKINLQIPTIFLTAKNNIKEKIEGLKLGAADYITKPFDLEELLLRINNVLKHSIKKKDNLSIYKFNHCEINFSTYIIVKSDGTKETLTKREIALLKMLIENKNAVISRDQIIEKLWTKDENPSSRTIDNYILNFRKLFEINQKNPSYFLSIRGVGYKFNSLD